MIMPCTKEVVGSFVKKNLLEASYCIKGFRSAFED
jgi:hypothetical protein